MKNGFMQPSEKEIAELEAQRQEEHDEREVFEAELAGSKGEAYPDDPFVGTDPASAKERRQARGWVAREDFESPPVDLVDSYVGPKTAEEARATVTSYEELRDFAQYKGDLAREKYPDFDDVIRKFVLPELERAGITEDEQNKLILQYDDLVDRAYHLGKERQQRLAFPENYMDMDPDTLTEWLDNQRGGGDRGGDRESEPKREFISRRELKRMNRIANPVDFGKALDALKWRG